MKDLAAMSEQHVRPMTPAATHLYRNLEMKFGYSRDETGNWHIAHEEAAVVRFVFAHYVNNHKSMDVLAFSLPTEVSPGALGGTEWLRRHVHTILSDSNYAGLQATPTGFAPGQYPPIIPIELFNAAQQRRCRKTNPNHRTKTARVNDFETGAHGI